MSIYHDVSCLFGHFLWLDLVNNEGIGVLWVEDLSFQSLDSQLLNILINQLNRLLQQTVSAICSVDHWCKVWNTDEIRDAWNVPVVPELINQFECFSVVLHQRVPVSCK